MNKTNLFFEDIQGCNSYWLALCVYISFETRKVFPRARALENAESLRKLLPTAHSSVFASVDYIGTIAALGNRRKERKKKKKKKRTFSALRGTPISHTETHLRSFAVAARTPRRCPHAKANFPRTRGKSPARMHRPGFFFTRACAYVRALTNTYSVEFIPATFPPHRKLAGSYSVHTSEKSRSRFVGARSAGLEIAILVLLLHLRARTRPLAFILRCEFCVLDGGNIASAEERVEKRNVSDDGPRQSSNYWLLNYKLKHSQPSSYDSWSLRLTSRMVQITKILIFISLGQNANERWLYEMKSKILNAHSCCFLACVRKNKGELEEDELRKVRELKVGSRQSFPRTLKIIPDEYWWGKQSSFAR